MFCVLLKTEEVFHSLELLKVGMPLSQFGAIFPLEDVALLFYIYICIYIEYILMNRSLFENLIVNLNVTFRKQLRRILAEYQEKNIMALSQLCLRKFLSLQNSVVERCLRYFLIDF